MDRIRVAALQYFVRPIRDWSQFEEQVRGLVYTAADYGCHLLVFPEYFTVQLLTLGDVNRPMVEQVRTLASHAPRFLEFMSKLVREYGIYVVGGSIPVADPEKPGKLYNDCPVFAPDGSYQVQGKLHMTRFETESWKMSPRRKLRIFDTELGRMAVMICYDVEFPELARAAAHEGATLLVVASYTEDRQGFLRVRYCAQARAIENQMYVIHSTTVGSLPMVPAVSLNYGQASILTPSDFPFARDGILAEGQPNQETMVIGELNLRTLRASRRQGTVRPLRDSRQSASIANEREIVPLIAGSSQHLSKPVHAARRRLAVRNLQREDFHSVQDLARVIYPGVASWTEEQLQSHLEVFPEGQFVAVEQASGLLAGTCSSLIIDWNDYSLEHDWSELTAGGMFTNHDPVKGSTLYAADVMVRPGQQGRGVGRRLYEKGRFGLARHLGLWRIRAGARLRGYHKHAAKMTPEEYVTAVVQGKLRDNTLSFQLKQGFRVIAVVSNYFGGDTESLGFAAVIEWLNDEVADPADYEKGDPRFRSPPKAGAPPTPAR